MVSGVNVTLKGVKLKRCLTGWSPYYTKYGKSEKHHSVFLDAENHAKKNRLNIWSHANVTTKKTDSSSGSGEQYHGNTKSYKFHRSSCRYYNCKNCVRNFNSREEAIKAGYQPCGVCKP